MVDSKARVLEIEALLNDVEFKPHFKKLKEERILRLKAMLLISNANRIRKSINDQTKTI